MRIVPPGKGELVRENEHSRAEIVTATGELVLVRFRYSAGRDGPEHHVHHHHCDGFFILAGTLQLDLGPDRESFDTLPGTLAIVPTNVVHTFRNASDADVAFLNLHAPGMQFDRHLRGEDVDFDQHDPPDDGGRPLTHAVVTGPGGAEVSSLDELAVVELWLEPPSVVSGRDETPVGFFVVEGTAELGGGAAPAGTYAEFDPGEPWEVTVAADGGARLLRLRAPAHAGGDVDE